METLSEVRRELISPSDTNNMFRAQKDLTEQALQELTDSIKEHGVLQSISLRPNPGKEGHFLLIAGERRFHASGFAGLTKIPANIFYVSEEVALQMQITENIQRKDVHPLDEAIGYKRLLDQNAKQTAANLAATFGKSETYIAQRLKLNDLIKEARKDFYGGKMNTVHATMIARLTPNDQREIVRYCTEHTGGYGRVNELQGFIDRNIMNCLSKAPFDINDPLLHKQAGACVNCPLRSGSSPLLFGDVTEKDRCFNRACYKTKTENHLLKVVTKIVETEPEILFLKSHENISENVKTILEEHQIKVLSEYSDFSQHTDGKKVKGLWLSGNMVGKIQSVVLKRPDKGTRTDDPEAQILRIQSRIVRGKVLDKEKVYAKVLHSLQEHPTQKKVIPKKLSANEEAFLWYVIYDKAGFSLAREFEKLFKLDNRRPENFYQALLKLSDDQKAFMLRRVMLDQFGGNSPENIYAHIIQRIAADYGDIDLATFEKEQKEIQVKREERQQAKINSLKAIVKKYKATAKKAKPMKEGKKATSKQG